MSLPSSQPEAQAVVPAEVDAAAKQAGLGELESVVDSPKGRIWVIAVVTVALFGVAGYLYYLTKTLPPAYRNGQGIAMIGAVILGLGGLTGVIVLWERVRRTMQGARVLYLYRGGLIVTVEGAIRHVLDWATSSVFEKVTEVRNQYGRHQRTEYSYRVVRGGEQFSLDLLNDKIKLSDLGPKVVELSTPVKLGAWDAAIRRGEWVGIGAFQISGTGLATAQGQLVPWAQVTKLHLKNANWTIFWANPDGSVGQQRGFLPDTPDPRAFLIAIDSLSGDRGWSND